VSLSRLKMDSVLVVAAVAFWGWQTGQWAWAVPVAAVLGASFHLDLRWDFSRTVQYRAADLSYLAAAASGIAFFLSDGNPQGLVRFFQWLPVALLPLMLVHAYGTAGRIDGRVLSWRLRRRPPAEPAAVDPWFAYFALWLIAAAAANVRDAGFYAGLAAIAALGLWRLRPPTARLVPWLASFALAAGAGYGLQAGLFAAHVYLNEAVPQWITGAGSLTDPFMATTRMGEGGGLDQSDAIALRIVPADGRTPPRLFHAASYDTYSDRRWLASRAPFLPLRLAGSSYALAPPVTDARRVLVHDHLAGDNPVLALPPAAVALDGLRQVGVKRNRLDTVQAKRAAGLFSYAVAFAAEPGPGTSAPEDLALPRREREAFDALAARLRLAPLAPAQRVGRVQAFFADGFTYSLEHEATPTGRSPVVDFVTRTKSGHCEYYATATVLLLRAAGVPARYATGYAVSERSALDDAWIARLRHRHAWAQAFVDGAWVDVDTTPPSWLGPSVQERGAWSTLLDAWAWVRLQVDTLGASRDGRSWLALGLAVALGAVLAWYALRLVRFAWARRRRRELAATEQRGRAGTDSEFYAVERQLRAAGLGRDPADTVRDWLARVGRDARVDAAALAAIVALHERYRFDPQGLTPTQRAELRERAAAWLAATNAA
jgi:transglutaminase-like putative cysteine protease